MEQGLEQQIKEQLIREDIERLQNQQQNIIALYNDKQKEIETSVAEYNAKMAKLQKEAQDNVDKLDNEREQLRGSYQTLASEIEAKQLTLNTLLGIPNEVNLLTTQTNEITPEIQSEPETEVDESQSTVETTLTDDDIKAVEKLQEKSSQNQVPTEVKEEKPIVVKNKTVKDDVPEYLKDEYKK